MNPNFQRGVLLYEQDRCELAEAEFRQVLAIEPQNSKAHALLALCLSERKEYKEATEEGQLAVHHEPDSGFAHFALARVFYDRNRYKEALPHVHEAIRLDSWSPQYFSLLSAIHLEEKRWAEGLEAAERGLQVDPEHVGCANLRAIALVKLGRKAEAGTAIDTALAKNPDNAMTHANQGWTLLHQGNAPKALEHFREALRLDPENEWARQGIVEALKAHYFIYSWMLKYFLWMSKLSGGAQWGIILGGYFGNRVLAGLARTNPDLAPWILPVRIIYTVFVILTWTADPLFNLLLRLNRFGRLALSREQIVASNWLGATIAIAIASLGAWIATGSGVFLLGAVVFGFLALPVSGVFKCATGWPRAVMALYTIGLAAVGLLSAISLNLLSVFLLGIFLSAWVANGLIMVRTKH